MNGVDAAVVVVGSRSEVVGSRSEVVAGKSVSKKVSK